MSHPPHPWIVSSASALCALYFFVGFNFTLSDSVAMLATSRCLFEAPKRRAVFGSAFWTEKDVHPLWVDMFFGPHSELEDGPNSGPPLLCGWLGS